MKPPELIFTERLCLRPPSEADAEAVFDAYASDPEVTRYLTWKPHESVGETRDFLRRSVSDIREGRVFSWVITEAPSEKPIGMIALSRDNAFCMHLGYVLSRAHWGRGLITEAARGVAEWVQEQPEVWRLYAVCDVENRASARVMEKLGFRYEGLLRRALLHVNTGEVPRDVHCYAWTR